MQEITTREKLFALLGFFILLFSLPLALLVVRQRVTYRGRATGVASVPKQVMVTNVHAKGFTVSWLTDNQTNGSVFNGTTEIQDVRGSADTYYTHYVDVLGLTQLTDYYIKIKSGPKTYAYSNAAGWYETADSNAQGLLVKTAKQIGDETQPPSASNPYGAYSTESGAFGPCPNGTLDASGNPVMNPACFRPYPLWGEVKNSSGQAVAGALVYAAIREMPDSKYALSAISGSDGKWSLDLANQYTDEFQNYLAYTPSSDKINIAANSNQGAGVANNLGMVSVLSTTCTNPPTTCEMNAPSPVMLTLVGGSSPTPTPTPTATNPPGGSGINFVINKVELQGRSDHTMTYSVKFRQSGSANTSNVLASVNTATNAQGISALVNVANLSQGQYDVYVVPSESYLSAKKTVAFSNQSVTLNFTNGATINGTSLCEGGTKLCAGDIKSQEGGLIDEVDIFDYGKALIKFGQDYPQADFNKSGAVDIFDYGWTLTNFGKKGADRP